MNKFRFMTAVLVVTTALGVPGHAGPARLERGRVVALPATAQWFQAPEGRRQGLAFARQAPAGIDNRAVYLLELTPGADYTLGLRYRAEGLQKPVVRLYSNWPGDPGAKSYKFPTGPVVRTDPAKVEYRWRLSVSPRSQGNLAFLAVEFGNGFSGREGSSGYALYLATPAARPENLLGTGITYLRGPSDLMLSGQVDTAAYVVEFPYSGGWDNGHRGGRHSGDLIINGDFSRGLEGWEMLSSGESNGGQVSVGKSGLHLGNIAPGTFAGVRQPLKRYIGDAGSLWLAAALMFDGREGGRDLTRGEAPVLEIGICYVDVEGRRHCGEDAYRRSFIPDLGQRENEDARAIGSGRWFRFEDEITALSPKPEVLESVIIKGFNLSAIEAWVDPIALTVK